MNFRVSGLCPKPFQHLFGSTNADLAALGVQRHCVDRKAAYPDRIELRDAEPGETVLLLNYTHQPADTPYRASHAIFILEGALATFDQVNEVPEALRRRILSLRAFDTRHQIIDADLVEGQQVEGLINRLLASSHVAYIHAHYAKHGCYAARIERA